MMMLVRVVAAAGLAVDAYVHLHLAGDYDGNRGALLGQGELFRVEAAVAGLAALTVLLIRRPAPDALVGLVALSAAAAAVVYRYVDVGAIAGLPDMYEPAWFPEKTLSAAAETLAALAVLVLLAAFHRRAPGRLAGPARRGTHRTGQIAPPP